MSAVAQELMAAAAALAAALIVLALLGGLQIVASPVAQMLDGAPGYTISPESWCGRYDTLGRGRTFITDKQAISDIIGEFESLGDTVRISADQAKALERAMGLQPGSLADGFSRALTT